MSSGHYLCNNSSTAAIYYSTDAINWTISSYPGVSYPGALAISETYAIGYGYPTAGGPMVMIYSTDGGETWDVSSTTMGNIMLPLIGTLSGLTGVLLSIGSDQYYTTTDGGYIWSPSTTITDETTNICSSPGSSSTSTYYLWITGTEYIYYSTTAYLSGSIKLNGTYASNSLIAISGSYGLVAVYNGDVYIVNLADSSPSLVKCYSVSNAWTGLYISQTASSGALSAIITSNKSVVFSSDITKSTIEWIVSTETGFQQSAINESTALSVPSSEGYIFYSLVYSGTWIST